MRTILAFLEHRLIITPFSAWSLGGCGHDLHTLASAAWVNANRAIYVPFRIPMAVLCNQMFTYNGATASNNIDIGLYDHTGKRLVSMGSTAQSGTNAIQLFNIADLWLGPGLFYMAMAMDGATGTVFGSATYNIPDATGLGIAIQETAFALPATATFASPASSNRIPMMGLILTPKTVT
jgi:hypothetical protein